MAYSVLRRHYSNKLTQVLAVIIVRAYMDGMKASSPVFHKVTRTLAESDPVRMRSAMALPRPVLRAVTPKQIWSACTTALLPLPFWPLISVTCGLQGMT